MIAGIAVGQQLTGSVDFIVNEPAFERCHFNAGQIFLFGVDACGGRFFMATVLVFVAVPPFLFMLTFFTMIFLMLALLTGDFLMIVATGSMIMTGFLMSIFLCLYKRKWGCKQRQCEY